LKRHRNSGIAVLHALRCLVNVCSCLQTPVLSKQIVDGIPVIISCMDTNQIVVQSEVMLLISAIARNSSLNKERIHQLGGIEKINCAYDMNTTTPYDDQSVVTKIRACSALTTLAVDPIILSDIQEKGIIWRFERLLDDDPNIPEKLRNAIQDLLTFALNEQNSDEKLILREEASEEETCDCFRANLGVVATLDFTPNRIIFLRAQTTRAMGQFMASASVHENGCKLLACLFDLASDCESDTNGIIASEELETILEELEILTRSLGQHSSDPVVAAAACSALQNLCVLLSRSSFDYAPGFADHVSISLTEGASALSIHPEDEQTLIQITGALWALCAMREGLAVSFETDNTIGLLTRAMHRFPNSADLHRYAIAIFELFFSVSNRVLDFINDELVTIIMTFIDREIDSNDAADFIASAVNIILSMTNRGFRAVTILLRNETLINTMVRTMEKFPHAASIQGAGIGILTSMALENSIRGDIFRSGGATRIIASLDNVKNDAIIVSQAFSSLSNLMVGADFEILLGHEVPVAGIFIRAVTTHPKNLSIQIDGAHALWALSAVADSFKVEIINLGGAEVISNAMTEFIGSKHMQSIGFKAIWSLSVPKNLKRRIGQCAIEAVVNGFSAHLLSQKECEDAMGCLKCLSSIPPNKELLEEFGGFDLIYSCMWMHSETPSVCRIALAALHGICISIDTNEVSDLKEEELDVIVNVVRIHSTVRAIQENAIGLLRNFTFSSLSMRNLERNPFVVPLVHSAVTVHNDHFRGWADDLLQVLPALR